MIRVKKKFNKKLLTALILLISFVVLLTASILMNIFLDSDGESGNKHELLEVLDGESIYGSYNVAYPYIADAKLNYISVSDKSNSFRLARPDEKGDMILYYTNAEGRLDVYYPNILSTDENIEYSSLYAIDQSDGMGMIPAISYLCSAVGFTAFEERIKLSDDPDVNDVIKFLRQREVVHYQRFGDALRIAQDNLDSKNFYAFNPSFDQ